MFSAYLSGVLICISFCVPPGCLRISIQPCCCLPPRLRKGPSRHCPFTQKERASVLRGAAVRRVLSFCFGNFALLILKGVALKGGLLRCPPIQAGLENSFRQSTAIFKHSLRHLPFDADRYLLNFRDFFPACFACPEPWAKCEPYAASLLPCCTQLQRSPCRISAARLRLILSLLWKVAI